MVTEREKREREIVDRLLNRFESRYAKRIRTLRNSVIEQATELFAETGITFSPDLLNEYRLELARLSRQNSDAVIPFFSKRLTRQFRNIITDIERIDNTGFHTFLKEDWAQNFALGKSQLAAETTFFELQNVIRNGINQELTRDEIVKNLLDTQKLSRFRARTIARTETHQASQFASQKTAERIESDLQQPMLKVWVPVQDDRTRPDHIAMLTHPPVPLTGTFDVGGEDLRRPGDPSGSPGNVINCRCVLTYRVES